MTERTLRDQIAALTRWDPKDYKQGMCLDDNGEYILREAVLRLLDAHTAAQPAPDAVAEAEPISPEELAAAFRDNEAILEWGAWFGELGDHTYKIDGTANMKALADWINAHIAKGPSV
ncbi:hypothetical protein [Paracoccus sp. SY]|uniref:hypothetical protein n=1 Tax=Paracoccus sp. SY TaxID=1330255 RepID=UPI000CD2E71E|nr:hypothetical protein [Paracoccus sp. SY]